MCRVFFFLLLAAGLSALSFPDAYCPPEHWTAAAGAARDVVKTLANGRSYRDDPDCETPIAPFRPFVPAYHLPQYEEMRSIECGWANYLVHDTALKCRECVRSILHGRPSVCLRTKKARCAAFDAFVAPLLKKSQQFNYTQLYCLGFNPTRQLLRGGELDK